MQFDVFCRKSAISTNVSNEPNICDGKCYVPLMIDPL